MYIIPDDKTTQDFPASRPTKEMAARLVARGQGLIDVNSPSHKAHPDSHHERVHHRFSWKSFHASCMKAVNSD